MWRRSYLLLLLVRLYFALAPSYLHPDENFQGPEVIAGELFPYPTQKTWEWTSERPIRSVFPLWPVYGIPMILLKWIWTIDSKGTVHPGAIYYALRLVMFALSFVLEDWAIHELVHSPHHRRKAVILLASSYVTWSYQSHTFSNSIETILVSWSIVLIQRIAHEKNRSSVTSCAILSLLVVFGVYNRITFPAFIVIPGLQILPYVLNRPMSLFSLVASAIFCTFLATTIDTAFYHGPESTASFTALYKALITHPIITPWNNVRYNMQTSNLALHGLHPHYQHFLVNLPQLLGPALILLLTSLHPFSIRSLLTALSNPRFLSAVSGAAILSIFPHQEPRFLLPCVPLLLTCVRLPNTDRGRKWFWTSWVIFNIVLGSLMGVYHQGGIIPAQLQIPKQISLLTEQASPERNLTSQVSVFWWKTYPPPTYLLGNHDSMTISTVPLMGLRLPEVLSSLSSALPATCNDPSTATAIRTVLLVAPLSSNSLPDAQRSTLSGSTPSLDLPTDGANSQRKQEGLQLSLEWSYSKHINLDDIDISEDGVWGTLGRVVGRRGIGIWSVQRSSCV